MIKNNQVEIYRTADNQTQVEVRFDEETVWLSQLQMAELFNQTKQNISLHINNCYREGELDRKATVKEYLTVQTEGTRVVRRNIEYYNLDMIISVGYRVKSMRGTEFRQWATQRLKDYLIKGYAINERRFIDGWRTPTHADFFQLSSYLGGISFAGPELIDGSSPYWQGLTRSASNSSNFTALPNGSIFFSPKSGRYEFQGKGTSANFWTSEKFFEIPRGVTIENGRIAFNTSALFRLNEGAAIRLLKD